MPPQNKEDSPILYPTVTIDESDESDILSESENEDDGFENIPNPEDYLYEYTSQNGLGRGNDRSGNRTDADTPNVADIPMPAEEISLDSDQEDEGTNQASNDEQQNASAEIWEISSSSADEEEESEKTDDESDSDVIVLTDSEEVSTPTTRNLKRRHNDYQDERDDGIYVHHRHSICALNNKVKEVKEANDFDSEEDSIPFLFNFNPRPTEEEKALNLSEADLAERRERRFWIALENFFSDDEQVTTKKAKLATPEPPPEPVDIVKLITMSR